MANVLLVGSEDTEWDAGSSSDKFRLSRYQAVKSGTAKTLKHYTAVGQGYCKLALYADSSGSPGALLAATALINANAYKTWFEASISDVSIVSGRYYWIAWITNYGSVVALNSGVGTNLTKDQAYSGFSYPNPAGSGFSSLAYQGIVACMGEESAGGTAIPILMQQYRRRVI